MPLHEAKCRNAPARLHRAVGGPSTLFFSPSRTLSELWGESGVASRRNAGEGEVALEGLMRPQ